MTFQLPVNQPTDERIQFARVPTKVPWKDFLMQHYALSSERAQILCDLGCIYLNQKRWFPTEEQNDFSEGEIIRLHLQPRRYPLQLLNDRTWYDETENWVALWKPAGLPSHMTLDNKFENSKDWLEKKISQPLWSLSRLDIGTRGLLLFAKNQEFARSFHGALEKRQVQKFYETLSPETKMKTGPWFHWMQKSERAPRIVRREKGDDFTVACELIVESQTPITGGVCSRVQLLTGRTHQIRAQFQCEDAPLFGDVMYKSEVPRPDSNERFALSCEHLNFQWKSRDFKYDRPTEIEDLKQSWGLT